MVPTGGQDQYHEIQAFLAARNVLQLNIMDPPADHQYHQDPQTAATYQFPDKKSFHLG